MDVKTSRPSRATAGLSLVGLLMVVVVLGALTATAFVGVSSLTGSGTDSIATVTSSSIGNRARTSTTRPAPAGGNTVGALSACRASADAATSASTAYFVNSGGQSYPAKWSDLTAAKPPLFTLATNVVMGTPTELVGRGWTLTMSGDGATTPTFTCS